MKTITPLELENTVGTSTDPRAILTDEQRAELVREIRNSKSFEDFKKAKAALGDPELIRVLFKNRHFRKLGHTHEERDFIKQAYDNADWETKEAIYTDITLDARFSDTPSYADQLTEDDRREFERMKNHARTTDNPKDAKKILDEGRKSLVSELGHNPNFPPTLNGYVNERVFKANYAIRPSIVANVNPEDTKTMEWVASQPEGIRRLIRFHPSYVSTDDVIKAAKRQYDNEEDQSGGYSIDGYAVDLLRERIRADESLARELTQNDDVVKDEMLANSLAQHKNKTVRMALAKNPNTTPRLLLPMMDRDRSKLIKEEARKNLVARYGEGGIQQLRWSRLFR